MRHSFITIAALAASSLLPCRGEDTLTIVMNPLKDVEITASVKQTTLNHETIDRAEMQTCNTGLNLPYLLSQTPSLTITSDDGLGIGYTYFRVRGTDHGRINVTINDIPINDAESQVVYFVNLPDLASGLEKMDIQRGVGSSTNGSAAFGASMNMLTHTHDIANHLSIGFNGGMYNTFRENISGGIALNNHWYATARFSKINSDGYLERAQSDLYSYGASFGYFTHQTEAYAEVFGGKEKTYMAWNGVTQEQLQQNHRYNSAGEYIDDNGQIAYYPDQNDNYAQQHIQLHWNQRWTPQWHTGVTLHYTHGGGYYEQYRTDMPFASVGQHDFQDSMGILHTLSDHICRQQMNNHFLGGTAHVKFIHEKAEAQFGGATHCYLGDEWGNLLWLRDSLYPYSIPFGDEYYRNNSQKWDANIYLRANWYILQQTCQRLTLYGDLQYRYVDYRITGTTENNQTIGIAMHQTYHFFNPKAGLTYERKGHQLCGSFAIANREPTRKNFTEGDGHEFPKPERLYDYELGYDYHGQWGQNKPWNVGINLYFMDYDNQMVLNGKLSTTTEEKLTTNVAKSYRAGIELMFGVDWTRWFRWEGNITLSRNRILNYHEWINTYDSPNTWNYTGQTDRAFGEVTIAMSPSVTANNRFIFRTHGFSATLHTTVVSKQYLDNTMSEDAILKPYCITNLYMDYLLPLAAKWPDIRLKCQINNMFDARYESNGGSWSYMFVGDNTVYQSPWYYAQAGINVHAGFTIDW